MINFDNLKVSSILKNKGVFISITFAQPHFRKLLYAKEKYNWSIEQFTIGETFHYFVYVMTKGEPLNQNDKYFYCRNGLSTNTNINYLKEEDYDHDFLNQIKLD